MAENVVPVAGTKTPAIAVIEASSGDSHRHSAQIVEVSDAGLKLKVKYPYEVGSMVRVELPSQELGPVTTVLACVMQRKDETRDLWQLSCQFCTELDDEDLESLGIKRELIKKPENDN
ncbi:MAG TPA: PilZ domain-containing protein, partial [Gemmatales bacterium]|nr:PilZ domain-containing protein [Gemmatales bacterium]